MNALGEAFRAALASLNAHRLRSFLTTLGILIGTMAVIAVVSVLQGFSDSIRDQFSDLGSNSLTLEALNDEENWRSGRINRLSFADIDALRYKVPGVKDVAPIIVANLGAVTWRTRNVTPQILGTTEDAQSVLGTATRLGRFITASDDQGGRRVVVIGVDVRDKLKLPRDPVGEFVLIGREWFKVVGVLEKRGEIFGFSQDNRAFIPFSVARSLTGTFDEPYMEVSFTVDDIGQVAQVKERALRAVRTTRGIKAGMTDDFEVKAADSFLKQFNQITGTATAVLAGIVGISLLAGDDRAARRDRRGEPAGGRHRHHEHHAGVGHRAHARDRHPEGARRHAPRHPDAVPARGRAALAARWPDRHRARAARRHGHRRDDPGLPAGQRAHLGDAGRGGLLGAGRRRVRHRARLESRVARSDRGPALRMTAIA
jgi:putative ABC transport system permease protein